MVAEELRNLADKAPIVIVLDDLHAADSSSLFLVHFVAREVRSCRLLLVGTFRDVEAQLRADVAESFARATREGRCLGLRRLPRPEASRLMRSSAESITHETVEAVFQATQGNPLFIGEVMRLLAAQPELAERRSLPIPFGLREVIRQQLSLLSEDARSVLDTAAVFGVEFRLPAVAELLHVSTDALAEAFREAAEKAAIVSLSEDRFAFSHALVREAIYRDMPHSHRMNQHARAGDALQRLGPNATSAAEIAHHYLEAGAPRIADAVSAVVRASEEALAFSACEDALQLLQRVQGVLDRLRIPRLTIEVRLAEARALGHMGDRRQAQHLCLRAVELARELGDRELFARAVLGYGEEFNPGFVDPVLVRLLEESLERGLEGALRARVLARLAAAVQPTEDFEVPVRIARQAVEAARSSGDRTVLLDVIHAAVASMMDLVDPLERSALSLEQLRLAEELGDRPKRLRAHLRLAIDFLEMGDMARVDIEIDAYEILARELKRVHLLWKGRALRALRAVIAGRFVEADAFFDEARSLAVEGQDSGFALTGALFRQGRLAAQARFDELLLAANEASSALRAVPDGEHFGALLRASAFARSGRAEQARTLLEAIPRAWLERQRDQTSLGWVAESVIASGDRALLEQTLSKLRPLADRCSHAGLVGLTWEGPITAFVAAIEAALGQFDEAERHYEDTRRRLATMRAEPHLARVDCELAEMLITRGEPEDVERARLLFGGALSVAARLMMPGLAARIKAHQTAMDRLPCSRHATFALYREGDSWSVEHPGGVILLRHTRGLEMLAMLVERAGEDIHVTELMAGKEPVDGGDAGEVLDRRAMAAYRERLEALRDDLREAETFANLARASRAREEIDALTEELSRAVGIGGRVRRVGSATERARVAVRKRLREAILKIAEHAPTLGHALERDVSTGTYCSYHPPEPRPSHP
jgi:tetratricopeptide (TPR) repeat protein